MRRRPYLLGTPRSLTFLSIIKKKKDQVLEGVQKERRRGLNDKKKDISNRITHCNRCIIEINF